MTKGEIPTSTNLTIPLKTLVAGTEATVTIDSNNTTVSEDTFSFATISNTKLTVSPQSAAEKVSEEGYMPTLFIEESYGGQIRHFIAEGLDNTILLRLNHPDFKFEISSTASLTGLRGFDGLAKTDTTFTLINDQQLQITLPDAITTLSPNNKGALKLEGVTIRTTNRTPSVSEAVVSVSGAMVTPTDFTALTLGDYHVELILPAREAVYAGTEQTISFTLEEDMKNSLLKDRPLIVTLPDTVEVITDHTGKVPVQIDGTSFAFEPLVEKGKCIGFSMASLQDKLTNDSGRYTFSFSMRIPVRTIGPIALTLEGRALPETLTGTILTTKLPLLVNADGFHVQSAMKDQYGGSITLTEEGAGVLQQGKSLFITLDTSHLTISSAPNISVVSGDLVLGDLMLVDGGIEIPIQSSSTQPSTILLKHFGLTLDGTVPAGRYEASIGGPALSTLSTDTLGTYMDRGLIDPVAILDQFILVDVDALTKKVITFRLGDESYAVNGKYYHLDTPAYIENGRVMVPIRYVAEALGLSQNQMVYDETYQTFALYAQKVIEVTVGSNILSIDGIPQTMQTPTTLLGNDVMVPISEIAKALGVEVSWNAALKTATFIQYGN